MNQTSIEAQLSLQMFAMPTMCLKCHRCGTIWSTKKSVVSDGVTVAMVYGWTMNRLHTQALCPKCSSQIADGAPEYI